VNKIDFIKTISFTGHRPDKLGGYGDTPCAKHISDVVSNILSSIDVL